MKYLAIFCLLSSAALAADAPTVTLTQDQLQRLVTAESAKAMAQYAAQEKAAAAKDAYELIEKAFAPKPPVPPVKP